MAGLKPFFLTGGNARILLNHKTVAYATDVTYRISVKHATPRVLGRFEVEVIQPLTYDVMGTLSIIRYGRGLQGFVGDGAPHGTDNRGNSIGSYGAASAGGAIGSALGLPTVDGQWDGKADEAFNPSRFFQSMMFNIEIRQVGLTGATTSKLVGTVRGPPGDKEQLTSEHQVAQRVALKLDSVLNGGQKRNEVPVVVLRDCRFEDLNFKLNKRGVATIDLTFRARYVDDDTFIARKSGAGQEFS